MKSVRYVSEADELGRFELKPNYRALGPRFGKDMPHVAAAVAGLDAARAARTLRDGGHVHINVDGKEHAVGPDDVQLVLQPLEGYQVERSGSHAVALDLTLDDELRREGLAREVVHAVQNARKEAGLDVEDRISLALGGDDDLLAAVRAHEDYVTGETLATSLDLGDGASAARRRSTAASCGSRSAGPPHLAFRVISDTSGLLRCCFHGEQHSCPPPFSPCLRYRLAPIPIAGAGAGSYSRRLLVAAGESVPFMGNRRLLTRGLGSRSSSIAQLCGVPGDALAFGCRATLLNSVAEHRRGVGSSP